MRICYLLPYFPPVPEVEPSAYLDRLPLLRHLPQCVAARGHQVDVVLQHRHDARYRERGVDYHLVADRGVASASERLASSLLRREQGATIIARAAAGRAVALGPDVIHVHGMVPLADLAAIGPILGRSGIPWIAQHHGGGAATTMLGRRWQSAWMGAPAALLFTTRDHARPYVREGVLAADDSRVREVMETSTALRPRPRGAARLATGIDGAPALLSVARLHPVKDPLTVVRAFGLVAAELPDARLHLVYRSAELLDEVRAAVAAGPWRGRVVLHGAVAAADMDAVYGACDFLLQASRREFSGLAVLEAMACGVIPVVSDIPAFRSMLGASLGGDLLVPRGEARAMAQRVITTWSGDPAAIRRRLRERFERRFSFPVLADRMLQIYASLPGVDG